MSYILIIYEVGLCDSVCLYVCIYICMYVYMYVYRHVYIDRYIMDIDTYVLNIYTSIRLEGSTTSHFLARTHSTRKNGRNKMKCPRKESP